MTTANATIRAVLALVMRCGGSYHDQPGATGATTSVHPEGPLSILPQQSAAAALIGRLEPDYACTSPRASGVVRMLHPI